VCRFLVIRRLQRLPKHHLLALSSAIRSLARNCWCNWRLESEFIVGFHQIVTMVHSGTALLLFSLALISVSISVLIAVKPAADPANAGLVRKANVVGWIEISTAGLVTLSGLIAMYMGGWPLSQLWLWLSLLIMVFYSTVLKRVTKPARLVVAVGGSEVKSGMQVVLQIGHMLLLVVAYMLMLLKPV
jgi:uncharacterized membrane protein